VRKRFGWTFGKKCLGVGMRQFYVSRSISLPVIILFIAERKIRMVERVRNTFMMRDGSLCRIFR
jgi:hypothetical protein